MNAQADDKQVHELDRAYSPAGLASRYGVNGLGETIRHVLAVLRRNIWLVMVIVGLALAAALVLTMLTTPRYSAAASVQINDQSDAVLGDKIDPQSGVNSSWDIDRFLKTQLSIIQSRALAKRVAQDQDLFADKAFFEAMGAQMPEGEVSEPMRTESVIGMLMSGLSVDLPNDTRIVKIGFESTDPAMSARIANGFADQFIQASLQRRFDSSAYARDFVADQLEESRARLETSERELNAYARQAGLIRTRDGTSDDSNSNTSGSVVTSSLMQLNQAANDAQAARIVAESRWQAERSTPLLASKEVLGNPNVQELMKRRSQLEAEQETAGERYLQGHPGLAKLDDELAAVNRQLERTAAQVRNSVRAEYQAAQSAEKQLRTRVNSLQGASLAEQDRAVRYNTLAREADTNRSLYDGLLQRYRELNASAGVAASNISIIDRADPPLGPTSPNMRLNLALALLAGLGLAGVIVFLRDQLDDVVRIPEDVEEKIKLPLLGIVPKSASGDLDQALEDPKSPVSEAYGSLRGSLLYSTRSGLPKLIQVTSAQPTEGKSTSAYATAMGFARVGRKVLLVDADLRRPSVARNAGLKNERGLSSLLVSQDPVSSAVVASAQANLDLLPSGPLPPSPSELLTSPRMADLLEQFASLYDVVLIDSPPVLGLGDAPALSALVDGVVFVIEADRGRHGALKTAIKRLRAVDAVLLGAVLTKFDPEKAGNSNSTYYGYDYYHYESGEAARS